MQRKNFFMVPNRIFDLELKPRDFTVYCCLLRQSDSARMAHAFLRGESSQRSAAWIGKPLTLPLKVCLLSVL